MPEIVWRGSVSLDQSSHQTAYAAGNAANEIDPLFETAVMGVDVLDMLRAFGTDD